MRERIYYTLPLENCLALLMQIKSDVERQGDLIRLLIKEVEGAAFTDIEDVVTFVKWLDDKLSRLVRRAPGTLGCSDYRLIRARWTCSIVLIWCSPLGPLPRFAGRRARCAEALRVAGAEGGRAPGGSVRLLRPQEAGGRGRVVPRRHNAALRRGAKKVAGTLREVSVPIISSLMRGRVKGVRCPPLFSSHMAYCDRNAGCSTACTKTSRASGTLPRAGTPGSRSRRSGCNRTPVSYAR
jgi:hypothetical protein